jgi:thiamine-phosphate pyrophosphorylase
VTDLKSRLPLVCLITDRRKLGPTGDDLRSGLLTRFLEHALTCGIDLVQLREPDLSAREIFHLTRIVVDLAGRYHCTVLVNDRADIAAACGAGVHLTTRSLRPAVVRRTFGTELLMGVSTHNVKEVEEAQKAGADFVVFGPVFETESKKAYGLPVGLSSLEKVTQRFEIPVLALGGVNEANFREALKAGAAGIAGISIFTESADLPTLVSKVKEGPKASTRPVERKLA